MIVDSYPSLRIKLAPFANPYVWLTYRPPPAPWRVSSSHCCSTRCRCDRLSALPRDGSSPSRTSPTWWCSCCTASSTPWRCPSPTWPCSPTSRPPTQGRWVRCNDYFLISSYYWMFGSLGCWYSSEMKSLQKACSFTFSCVLNNITLKLCLIKE